MAKQATERREFQCPVYEILDRLCGKGKRPSEFADHIRKAQVELLLAVRSVLDRQIDALSGEGKEKAKARRIKVTEKS